MTRVNLTTLDKSVGVPYIVGVEHPTKPKTINERLVEFWNGVNNLELETREQEQMKKQILGLFSSILRERLKREK